VAGTIIADVIQSDQSYPSSINIASPMVVANTVTFQSPLTVSNTVTRTGLSSSQIGFRVTQSDTGNTVSFGFDNSSGRAEISGGTSFRIRTNGQQVFEISSAGSVNLPLGQLQFPATQNASADANTLDDYEEGNWSPVLLSNGGGTVSLGTGNYVKIAKMVLVGIDAFNVSLSGLSAGDLLISGFPFTQSGPTTSVSFFNIAGALSATQGAALAYLISNTTAVLYKSESTSFGIANITKSDLNANISIRFNGFYFTT